MLMRTRESLLDRDEDTLLHEIIVVNEEIKRVVGVAYEISLEATNAMLVARRAGADAVGFRVVATELRSFSRRIMQRMTVLQEVIYELSHAIANQQKRLRMHGYFGLVRNGCSRFAGELEHLLVQERDILAAAGEDIRLRRERLHQQANLAWKDCGIGRALSRNARVEAAAGGSQAGVLLQVAAQVEATIEHVFEILGRLKNAGGAART